MSKDNTKKRGIEKSRTDSDESLKSRKSNLVSSVVKKCSMKVRSSIGVISKKVKSKITSISNSNKERKEKSSKKSKYYDNYPKLDSSDKDGIEKHIKTISGYNEALKVEPLSKSSSSSDMKTKNLNFFTNISKKISDMDFLSYPFGIKLLVLFCLSNAFLFFILALKFPYLMYFGFNLEGNSARYLLIFFSLINIVVSFGLLFRKKWSVFVSIFWYGLGLVSSFISLFFIDKTIIGLLYDFFVFGLIVTTMINLSVIAYILHRREFLSSLHIKKLSISKFDYFFVSILVLFVILCVVSGTYLSLNFFTKISSMVSEYGPSILEYQSLDEGMKFCESTSDRDICILIYSIMLEKDIPSTELVTACKSIRSPFIRYTCYEGLNIR